MNGQMSPDQLMVQYFRLHARVASCAAIVMDGMPRGPRSVDAGEQHRVELAELHWYVQDLSPEERRVAEARVLGIGAETPHYRYLVNLSDVQPDEEPTGGRHPGDASLIEVRGRRTRFPTYHQLAHQLQLDAREVFNLYNAARRKVGLRLYWRRSK